MADQTAREVQIEGQPLECPVCKHNEFWSRETLMNTRGATFFKFDWVNKSAVNHICDRCGYVFWFLRK